MSKLIPLAFVVVAGWLVSLSAQQTSDPDYRPRRINKAIELLERGQPIYYTQLNGGGYEDGKMMAQTWADYITYNLEHSPFNVAELREFMQGLVDGGPTRSGHRTPAVICVLPVGGLDELTMKANYWMVEQVLSAGVHGVLLVHVRSPEAVRVFVQAARYPTHTQAVGDGLREGLRGSGGQGYAARIWGISAAKYQQLADPWPLNPEGEILLGLKIEDRHALRNAESSTRVPGIGFAEWGPGDMGMSLGHPDSHDPPYPEDMQAARSRVSLACQAAGLSFLHGANPENVVDLIDEGVKIIGAGRDGEETARRGREHTRRQMPV